MSVLCQDGSCFGFNVKILFIKEERRAFFAEVISAREGSPCDDTIYKLFSKVFDYCLQKNSIVLGI